MIRIYKQIEFFIFMCIFKKKEAAKFKKVKKKVRKIRKKEALKADDLLPLPNQDLDDTDYGSR